jgi:hypothetical protein
VTEIIANDREIDTRLEEGHSAAVAEGVGRHASVPEIRHLSGRAPCILADHISGSVTSEWGAAGVAEYGLIGRDSGGHRTQGHCCFGPERANALLAALAMEPHVLRPV